MHKSRICCLTTRILGKAEVVGDIEGTNWDPRKSMKSLTLFVPVLPFTDPCLSQSHLEAPPLQHFDQQSLFCTYFPSFLGEASPNNRVVLPNTQAASRIFLLISISVAEAICLEDKGKIQTRIKLHLQARKLRQTKIHYLA